MPDNCFVDTNVLIYSLAKDTRKQQIAFEIWRKGVKVSTQVVMEYTNVCIRQLKMNRADVVKSALSLMDGCDVVSVTKATIHKAFDLGAKYNLSHWDSLIVAASLDARCMVLNSEDMKHNLLIEDSVRILNPFIAE